MDHELAKVSKALLDVARYGEKVLLRTRGATNKLEQGQQRLLERVDGFRSIEQLIAISSDIVDVHATLAKLIIQGAVTAESSTNESDDDDVAQVRETAPAPVVAREPVKAVARTPVSAVATPVAAAKTQPAMSPKVSPAAAAKPVAQVVAAQPAKVSVTKAPMATAANSDIGVSNEVLNARKVLAAEAKILFGRGAVKLQPKIDACQNIEQIYDLVIRFKDHLASTGKGDPDVFLSRLSAGLSAARQEAQQA